MSTDPRLRTNLHRLLDGELDESEAPRVRAAIEADAELRAEYEELLELREIFRVAPRARASDGFREEVVKRVFESPFRTEVWPQVLPLIRRLSLAAGILGVTSLASARVEAVVRPGVLFLPGDPIGVSALRPALDDVGHALVRGTRDDGELLLRRFSEESGLEPEAGTTETPR
jgi:hypothetical protein